MAIAVEPQIYDQFKGIRQYNGVNAAGMISAVNCVNAELFKTDIGSGTGIRSAKGDKLYYSLPTGFKAIKDFTSNQDGVDYLFVYGEDANEGKLFYLNSGTFTAVVSGLTVTGECNGITMSSTAYNVFVFTNGVEVKTVCFTNDAGYGDRVKTITAVDYQGRSINWLSMVEWNGFLVVASQYGVHASHQNDIYTWNDNPQDVADSWYIDFGKKVTAVVSFSTGLFIFTKDDITHLNTTPNDARSISSNVAMNGCFSYESLCVHDTFLFFYDDNQKNIFYIQMTDTGQTRPTGPVAKEVQEYFNTKMERVKLYSCIYGTQNEIWLLINNKILIFDYINQEWTERQMPAINGLCMMNNIVLACDESGRIRAQKYSENFCGDFYASEYKTSIINFGSNTNLKKQKTPILLVLDATEINDFWVELTTNYKAKNPKKVTFRVANEGIWASEDPDAEITSNMRWDEANFVNETEYYSRQVVEVSTPQTWYTMQIRFYTDAPNQGFAILSMELKRIKEKLKTKGR